MSKPKVIVICGPTASGKTTLSIELAKKINGEIISSDSMQIYKDMDIGTAKPSKEEIARKKAQYKVPRSLNSDDVETFLQVESDVWSVLSANLDEDDYGGMYIEDDVLHIKTKKEQKVQSLVSQVKGCVPAKLRSATQKIVYENDCVYTMSELDTACDKIWNAEKNGEIDVVGIGTDEKLNGLIVDAPEWNDEKKQTISEISGIDMEHLIFEISVTTISKLSLLEYLFRIALALASLGSTEITLAHFSHSAPVISPKCAPISKTIESGSKSYAYTKLFLILDKPSITESFKFSFIISSKSSFSFEFIYSIIFFSSSFKDSRFISISLNPFTYFSQFLYLCLNLKFLHAL